MQQEQSIERVKKFVEKVLEKADIVDCEVVIVPPQTSSGMIILDIRSSQPASLLIGQNGENLRAMQYLVRLLVRKHLEDNGPIPFLLDINGYRQQKDQALFELVDRTAHEAKQEGKPIIMRPMNAYERRLVHTRLASDEEVTTESVGEGEERKVVVKPITSLD